MPVELKTKDISATLGHQLALEAATWKGTPFAPAGTASAKGLRGDCSGITYKVYAAVNCPYQYQRAAGFGAYALTSGLFRKLAAGEKKQDGDILSWANHMAIYCSFASDPANSDTDRVNTEGVKWTQHNDMWTASYPDGPAFGPAAFFYMRPDPPVVFRYQQ
jgi:hypothetical protein